MSSPRSWTRASTLAVLGVVLACWGLAPGLARADEALMIYDTEKVPSESVKLVYLHRNDWDDNALAPSPASQFRVSVQGEVAQIWRTPPPRGESLLTHWALVHPFRNRPYVQFPQFTEDWVREPREIPGRKFEVLSWSPDGKKFFRAYNGQIRIHHEGTGPLQTITDLQDKFRQSPQWGHDGQHLIFPHKQDYFLQPIPEGEQITWRDVGQTQGRLFATEKEPRGSRIERFFFSPDTKQVAYVKKRGERSLMQLHAGPVESYRLQYEEEAVDESGWNEDRTLYSAHYVRPRLIPLSWSQDSKRFYYYYEQIETRRERRRDADPNAAPHHVYEERMPKHELWVYDVDQGRVRKVMDLNWTPLLRYETAEPQPIVSEDERFLVFWGTTNVPYHGWADYRNERTKIWERIYRGGLNQTELIAVDLRQKSQRAIHKVKSSLLAHAAFVKTQKFDDQHTPPDTRIVQHAVQFRQPVQVVFRHGTYWLEFQFEGMSLFLPSEKDRLHVEATVGGDDGQLFADSDGTFNDSHGHVANYRGLSDSYVKLEENHFTGAMLFAFNHIELVGVQERQLVTHLKLWKYPENGERVLLSENARPRQGLVKVTDEQMPRVWFTGIGIQPATDPDGRSGIRVTGKAHIHRSTNIPFSIEAIVVNHDDSPIKTNDSAYKRTHDLYGVDLKVQPTHDAHWQPLDFFIPIDPMNLSSGEHRVAVNLRSYRGDRIYCGGTPPTFLQIKKTPAATQVGGDPSGAGPPDAGAGPFSPRPADGRPRRLVATDSPLAAHDPLHYSTGLSGLYHLQALAAKLPGFREQQLYEPDAVRWETFRKLSRSLQEARRLYDFAMKPIGGGERSLEDGFPTPETSPLSFISHLRMGSEDIYQRWIQWSVSSPLATPEAIERYDALGAAHKELDKAIGLAVELRDWPQHAVEAKRVVLVAPPRLQPFETNDPWPIALRRQSEGRMIELLYLNLLPAEESGTRTREYRKKRVESIKAQFDTARIVDEGNTSQSVIDSRYWFVYTYEWEGRPHRAYVHGFIYRGVSYELNFVAHRDVFNRDDYNEVLRSFSHPGRVGGH